ncbi:hypothetical protein HA039_24645 [Streptomyces liangshanensis]|uniref:Uncharacterized protein n=1 Tax=Streptomyces liangshanensis TaxID=2717324 RepID=A0A6G9H424_9ACTN|nr:hypothetical protein [Streptomyces liangshanensis]QIQ05039.1 hypothetical protein HA039_24645 [Streptomyces liangshanensis]
MWGVVLGSVPGFLPPSVRRLLLHEVRGVGSLARWVARRTHGVRDGDHAAPYTGPQTAMMYGLLFVSVVETVVLTVLLTPWPLVHRIMLVLDVYTVLAVLALHAGCVTRPHVAGADGSLRIRYGALFDLLIARERIASVRVERRYPSGGLIQCADEGVLDLVVGSQTSVRVELTEPVTFVRPLGRTGRARVIRFHADQAEELVRVLRAAGA